MYALTKTNPNKSLVEYFDNPHIKNLAFNGKAYTMYGKVRSGLIKRLKEIYYPDYRHKMKKHRKTKLQRKGSSIRIGKSIDKEIFNLINNPKKKPRNSHTKALVSYWESIEHTLQAAQVPVFIKKLNCCTQADVITQDKEGRLFLWEVKSGFNNSQKQSLLRNIEAVVPNCEKNHWQLQRHYTTEGLNDFGLNIEGSQIINVYGEKNDMTVKRKKNPIWCQKLK